MRSNKSPDPASGLALAAGKTKIFLIAGACLWIAAIILWRQEGWDLSLQVAHNALRANRLITDIARALSTYGIASCVLVLLGCFGLACKVGGLKDLRRIMLPVLLSLAIAGPAGDLSKGAFARPRPFRQYPEEIVPITRPAAYSLPSGHTTKVFALVLPFIVLARPGKGRKAVKAGLVLIAAAVAYSRIVLGVHFVGDILAGIGTALIALPLAAAAADSVYRARGMTEQRAWILEAACGLVLIVLIFTFVRNSL